MKISPVNYILVTDSASEPLTLTEVKDYLRITTTDYDNQLTPLITTARQLCEKMTGRDLINKTWKTFLDNFSHDYCPLNFYPFTLGSSYGIGILKSKLQSITSISYYTKDVLTVLDASKYYKTEEADYSSIYLKENQSFPSVDNRKQAVEIVFVSGYGADASFVPQALKDGMLSHIASMQSNIGDCNDCDSTLYKSFYAPYIISKLLFSAI
jgi:uncharacterized phiE125 gp8 family phage protein